MSRAPTARARTSASSARTRDSSKRPPSMRIWASPATARARASDGGSGGIRRIAVPVRLPSRARPGRRSRHSGRVARCRRPPRTGSTVSSTRRIAAWMCDTARAGSWKRATPASAARRSMRSRPARASASGTWSHSSIARSYWASASGNAYLRLGRDARGDRRFEGARQVVRGVPVIGELRRVRRVAGRRWPRGSARTPSAGGSAHPAAGRRRPPPGAGRGGTRSARCPPSDRGRGPGEPTHSRSASYSVVSSMAAAAASSAGSTRCPAAEATRRNSWVGSARSAIRASSTSRSVERQLGPAVLAGGDEQLLGEERVAAGSGVDRLDRARRRGRVPRSPAVAAADSRAVEGVELESLDAAGPFELGQERQQRDGDGGARRSDR